MTKFIFASRKWDILSSEKKLVKSKKINTHHDLEVWKRSIRYVTTIYQLTESFPSVEKFGLTSQIRRSAVSIPSNIAEGAARQSSKEFIRFLYISMGSLSELETQIIICENLNYLTNTDHLQNSIVDLKKMTNGLITYLKTRNIAK
mgnify:CR=1 FL=1